MRDKNVSIRGNLIRELIADITSTSLGEPIKTGKFRKHPVEPEWKCPDEYEYDKIDLSAFTMEYLIPKENALDFVILQLHGGGYIGPMKNAYRRFAVNYSEQSGGASVLTIDYRVAPEHPYPAALDDAIEAYFWLIKEKQFSPATIILAGDSAGGGLALALCLYLKDHGELLPSAIINMSPFTDLANEGESRTTKYDIDPLFGNTKENMLYNSSYLGEEDAHNPYISPIYGNFSGFPPMLMQVGTHEVLLSDTLTVAANAREQGVKVKCTVYEGMFHVFQMAGGLIPEAKQAWNEIGRFIQKIMK